MINENIQHIAIILDGNRRWAKERGFPIIKGHVEGVKNLQNIIKHANDEGLKYITVFCFSTENWKRSENEVKNLMKLLYKYTTSMIKKKAYENMRIKIYGDKSAFDEKISNNLKEIEEETKNNTGMTVGLCLNYGGRNEIVNATKMLVNQVIEGNINISDINEKTINDNLYTKDIPDPDLIIRTAGEKRISNFLIWQMAYSELYFPSVYWPDFDEKEFDKAIEELGKRNRRFGGN